MGGWMSNSNATKERDEARADLAKCRADQAVWTADTCKADLGVANGKLTACEAARTEADRNLAVCRASSRVGVTTYDAFVAGRVAVQRNDFWREAAQLVIMYEESTRDEYQWCLGTVSADPTDLPLEARKLSPVSDSTAANPVPVLKVRLQMVDQPPGAFALRAYDATDTPRGYVYVRDRRPSAGWDGRLLADDNTLAVAAGGLVRSDLSTTAGGSHSDRRWHQPSTS